MAVQELKCAAQPGIPAALRPPWRARVLCLSLTRPQACGSAPWAGSLVCGGRRSTLFPRPPHCISKMKPQRRPLLVEGDKTTGERGCQGRCQEDKVLNLTQVPKCCGELVPWRGIFGFEWGCRPEPHCYPGPAGHRAASEASWRSCLGPESAQP